MMTMMMTWYDRRWEVIRRWGLEGVSR